MHHPTDSTYQPLLHNSCRTLAGTGNSSMGCATVFVTQPIELFLVPANAPTTGVTKAMVCAILSVGWCI